jgi:hypothetical protein
MSQQFQSIPPPGSTLQSMQVCLQALVNVVSQLTGQRGGGAYTAALQTDLDAQIKTINIRLKNASIP